MTPFPFSQYSHTIIQIHLDALLKERAGVLQGRDLEYLHRMRIASRRLRTALWISKKSFKLSDYRYFRKEIRLVTRALGQARDLDTTIAYFNVLQKKHRQRQVKSFLNECLHQARMKRAALQKKIKIALLKLDQRHIGDRILQCLKDFPSQNKIDLTKVLQKKINKCLKDFEKYSSLTNKFKNQAELHRLRIAAKHLRYTLENFKILCGIKLNPFIANVTAIQGHLGDMRNQLVWKNEFEQMQAFDKNDPLLLDLVEQCNRFAKESYQKFIQVHERQQKLRTWNKLQKLICQPTLKK